MSTKGSTNTGALITDADCFSGCLVAALIVRPSGAVSIRVAPARVVVSLPETVAFICTNLASPLPILRRPQPDQDMEAARRLASETGDCKLIHGG